MACNQILLINGKSVYIIDAKNTHFLTKIARIKRKKITI